MTILGSDSPWIKGRRRRREQTCNDESSHTSLLHIFHWPKGKTPPSLYTQVPLHDPRTEIGLLEVLPGTGEIIECRLRAVPLANTGNYEGLSYHWSGGVLGNNVYVNGVHMPVLQNLWSALLALRYADEVRVLWVDAICIDQERNEEDGEKSYQLPLMRRIYEKAQRTIAYVGQSRDFGETHLLDGFVKELLRSIEQLRLSEEWVDSLGKTAHYLDTYMRRKYNIPNDDHSGWKTLGLLLSGSWVGHLWVVQEATVSRRVLIQWDGYSFDLEEIAAAYALMWILNVPEMEFISTRFQLYGPSASSREVASKEPCSRWSSDTGSATAHAHKTGSMLYVALQAMLGPACMTLTSATRKALMCCTRSLPGTQ